jgi:hypothetical protein
MKKVLIATDHSTAAQDAGRYALKLADQFNAEVVLHTEPAGQPGVVADGILAAAAAVQADLIVAGMKKRENGERPLLGSTVTALAQKTSLPLLVVPEGTGYQVPGKIVLANDLVLKMAIQIPDFVLDLSAKFHSKLYIVRFLNNHAGELIEILDYSNHFRRIMGVISPLYELPATADEMVSLAGYVDDHKFSLVAMPYHPHSLAEKWLEETPAGEMILKSHVPLLVLPEATWC